MLFLDNLSVPAHTVSKLSCGIKLNFRLRVGVPLCNALVCSDLQEYHHESYTAKTGFFGLHFCRRENGSNSNYCDVIGPQMSRYKISHSAWRDGARSSWRV